MFQETKTQNRGHRALDISRLSKLIADPNSTNLHDSTHHYGKKILKLGNFKNNKSNHATPTPMSNIVCFKCTLNIVWDSTCFYFFKNDFRKERTRITLDKIVNTTDAEACLLFVNGKMSVND